LNDNKIKYSVVIPVFNSGNSLQILLFRIKDFFKKENISFEVVFVDDFSSDSSLEILKQIKKENLDTDITIISLIQNYGQHKATLCGIENSVGDFIVTIDDDLQIDPEDIGKLIECQKTEDFDIVYGIYNYDNFTRNIGSKFINNIKKNNSENFKYSSFRLIKKYLIQKIHYGKYKTNIILDEIFYWTTGNVGFTHVNHKERVYNNSNYSTIKLFKIAIKTILFSSLIPLKIIMYSGFSLSVISFLFGIYFIYRKIFHNVPIGYTSVIVAILFSTSILLLSIAITIQYIKELYIQQFEKPQYVIKKIIK